MSSAKASASLPDGWLAPFGRGGWTAVGLLDGLVEATVDGRGLVTPPGRSWALDWWIGAEDRWRLPSREAAGVRQGLLAASPVVVTRVRVPRGDAVHRVYGARGLRGEPALVVEVENASTLPFALALAIRPYRVSGRGHIESISLDGSDVLVDGQPGLKLPKPPSRVAASTRAGGDSADVVISGAAGDRFPADLHCPEGLAQAAFVFPLAHTATLRLVLPLEAPTARRRILGRSSPTVLPAPESVPSAAQVAAGWAAHSEHGLRVELPDARLQEAVDANPEVPPGAATAERRNRARRGHLRARPFRVPCRSSSGVGGTGRHVVAGRNDSDAARRGNALGCHARHRRCRRPPCPHKRLGRARPSAGVRLGRRTQRSCGSGAGRSAAPSWHRTAPCRWRRRAGRGAGSRRLQSSPCQTAATSWRHRRRRWPAWLRPRWPRARSRRSIV